MNHDPNTNGKHHPDDELRLALLDLHYGLLEDAETAELKQRIENDAKVAKLWAETLVVAGKFAAAAKVSAAENIDAAKQTNKPAEPQPQPTALPTAHLASQPTPPPASPNRFLKLWFGSLATAATLAVAISGLRYWGELPAAPGVPVHLAVKPVGGAESEAVNEFLVVVGSGDRNEAIAVSSSADTFDTSMSVVPATISFKVLAEGAVLFFGETETTASGTAKIRVPDDIAIPGNALLHVDASPTSGEQVVRLTVPLEPTRCLTFVSTDRPVYRPGETVFFRSVTLNRRTLAAHLDVPIRYELIDAAGAVVDGAVTEGITERGVGNGAFVIPEASAGGSYQLVAKSLDGFFPDQAHEIEVRRYRAVRLKTDLEFTKRSYSADDRVEADLTVRRADDSIPAAAAVRIQAVVDEAVVYQSTDVLDINGQLSIAFDLPKVIRDGKGTLAIAIDDGSVSETAARPIPIHTGRAQVDFYPEGGYLVGGLDNRVYFAARDIDGKPIEIAGEVLSQSGHVVAKVQTIRDGLGRFQFKPESGQRYSLRITSPLDITETPWLPSVVEALPVLDCGGGVFAAGEPISMTVRNTKKRSCIIRLVCRGELVGVQTVDFGLGDTAISIPIQDRAAGVIRVTILDAEGETATPLVERLVYRKGVKELKVSATVDDGQQVHSPGQSVRMTIAVTDEQDRPVPGAVLGVSVVDDAALSLQQHETPSIKTHFLLTSEVESPEDLEHANFYLDDSAEAEQSLDLLLGTQGWRRFVSGTPDLYDETFREALTRLIELDGNRSGLLGDVQSNAPVIAGHLIDYRSRVTAAWQSFVSEIRFALLVIAGFWLVGFIVRPKKSTVATAGLLLLATFLVIQVGCSAQYEAQYSPASVAEQADSDAMFAESGASEQPSQSAPADPTLADAGAQASGANRDPSRSQAEQQPFVERVIRTFLGQRNEDDSSPIVHSRITPEQLRRWAQSRDLDAQELADKLMEELRFPIRQYAHLHRPSEDGVRTDFAETLYWNPAMVTDSAGTATIRFDLSDSLTMFRVHIDGHAAQGRLGSGDGRVVTKIPLQVEPKLPLEVTSGDRIELPVGLVNASETDGELAIQLDMDESLTADRSSATTSLLAGDRKTEAFPITVANTALETNAKIRISATLQPSTAGNGETLSDQVERSIRIVPAGFPFDVSQSGSLSKTASVTPQLPESIVPGSLTGSIELYPNTQSQLSAGLDSILREPHGCFEQASASNYPNVMAFGLLQLEGAVDDRAQRRTISLLRRGYRKLTSYECSTLGYEWFGNDPGHEALSAFGLMQFSEMAKFIEVDQEMLERTREWLLSRRDGRGGFQRNPRHLHVWSVQQEVVNAYLLWALSQADLAADDQSRTATELSSELDVMQRVADQSDDPYLIALSAITLGNVGRKEPMQKLLDRLTEMQAANGSLDGQTTVTQSGGISKTVETTALAILAWSHSPAHRAPAQQAAKWLIKNRRAGGFGSTQATVLALKSLIAIHDQLASTDGGSVDVIIDGKTAQTIRWEGRPSDGVRWQMTPEILDALAAAPTTAITLRNSDGSTLPFTLRLGGQTNAPSSDPDCPIAMQLSFAGQSRQASVVGGDSVEVVAEIANRSDEGRPMTVAVVGLPGGLEPVIESLDKLTETGEVDYYELRGREVILYWRTFAPQESKRIPVTCVATVPGKYTGPASRAYLYYTAESKTWHQPLVIDIKQ